MRGSPAQSRGRCPYRTCHDRPVDSFLAGLARCWWSVDLPGTRPHPVRYATYSAFDWRLLPPMPGWISDDYAWLASSRLHEESTLARAYDGAQRDIGRWDAWAEHGCGTRAPREFVRFARDRSLRRHLRSPTWCVFDLADHSVQVPGGRLIHFLSDSQWVRHWLLFIGDQGTQTVVTTGFPAGFELPPDVLELYADAAGYEICADTFLEFIWRLWIENEIWFTLTEEKQPLTPAQADYVNHYQLETYPVTLLQREFCITLTMSILIPSMVMRVPIASFSACASRHLR
jgi:hypothetical protein